MEPIGLAVLSAIVSALTGWSLAKLFDRARRNRPDAPQFISTELRPAKEDITIWNIPRLSSNTQTGRVERAALDKRFLKSLPRRLVVAAPSGYGKSLFINELAVAAQSKGFRAARIDIDRIRAFLAEGGKVTDFVRWLQIEAKRKRVKILVCDSLDDLVELSQPDGPNVARAVLDIELPRAALLVATCRVNNLVRLGDTQSPSTVSVVYIERWTQEQVLSFVSSHSVEMPNRELQQLLKVPFYAALYVSPSLSPTFEPTTALKLIETAAEREINRVVSSSQLRTGATYRVLEQLAADLDRSLQIDVFALESICRDAGNEVADVETIIACHFIGVRNGIVFFEHSLYRCYFVARYIQRIVKGQGKLDLLVDYQTSYYVDGFLAEMAFGDAGFMTLLTQFEELDLNQVQLVNVAGILAKTGLADAVLVAKTMVNSDAGIASLYIQAVISRLGGVDADDGTFLDEIKFGKDAIAAFLLLPKLRNPSTHNTASEIISQRYPYLTQKGMNNVSH